MDGYGKKPIESFISGAQDAIDTGNICRALALVKKSGFLYPEDVRPLLLAATIHLQLGDVASYLSVLRRILSRDSDNVEARRRMTALYDAQGLVLMESGHHEKALGSFSAAVEGHGDNPQYWLHRAIALTKLERIDEAILDIDRVLSLKEGSDEKSVEIVLLRAQLHWAIGNNVQGNSDLSRARVIAPGHELVQSFTALGVIEGEQVIHNARVLMLKGRFADAELAVATSVDPQTKANAAHVLGKGEFRTAVSSAPQPERVLEDIELLLLRAASRRLQGKYAEALRDIEKAAEYFAASRSGFDVAKALTEAGPGKGGSPAEAVGISINDVWEHPDIVRQRCLVFNDMALGMAKKGDFHQAVALINRVILFDAALKSTNANREIKQWRSQQQTEPNTPFSASRASVSVDSRFLLNRGDIFQMMGHVEAALKDYRAAYYNAEGEQKREAAMRLGTVHDGIGVQFFNNGNMEEAELHFSEAIRYSGRVARFFVHRGQAAFYRHNQFKAFKDYSTAIQLDPSNEEACRAMTMAAHAGKGKAGPQPEWYRYHDSQRRRLLNSFGGGLFWETMAGRGETDKWDKRTRPRTAPTAVPSPAEEGGRPATSHGAEPARRVELSRRFRVPRLSAVRLKSSEGSGGKGKKKTPRLDRSFERFRQTTAAVRRPQLRKKPRKLAATLGPVPTVLPSPVYMRTSLRGSHAAIRQSFE